MARALAANPAIVIMDEPTGNLDKKNGDNILQMIRDLRQATGTTFVIATHDANVAGGADRPIHVIDGLVHIRARVDASGAVVSALSWPSSVLPSA